MAPTFFPPTNRTIDEGTQTRPGHPSRRAIGRMKASRSPGVQSTRAVPGGWRSEFRRPRRDLRAGAGEAAGQAPGSASSRRWDMEADVVVVGYGAAGGAAAVAAVQGGASVIILERAAAAGQLAEFRRHDYFGGGTATQAAAGFKDTRTRCTHTCRRRWARRRSRLDPGLLRRLGRPLQLARQPGHRVYPKFFPRKWARRETTQVSSSPE